MNWINPTLSEISKAEVHVVDRSILEGIIKLCEEKVPNETVGFLYGKFYRWRNPLDGRVYRYIEVRNYVPLPGREERVTVHVDVEEMARILPKDRENVIVGWYHSHPGYGLFLSDIDVNTHRNAFSPRHTALVVDPTRRNMDDKIAFFTISADGRGFREMSFVVWERRS